jgi:hypothetical protein
MDQIKKFKKVIMITWGKNRFLKKNRKNNVTQFSTK